MSRYIDDSTGQIIEVDDSEATPDEATMDSMGVEQPKIQAQEAHDEKVTQAKNASEILFPRTTKAMKSGTLNSQSITASPNPAPLLDILSGILTAPAALGRHLDTREAYSGENRIPYLEAYQQISEGKDPEGKPSILSQIISDPSTVPSVVTGERLAKWVYKGGKWIYTIGKQIASGAAEGVISAGIHQAEKKVDGEEADIGEARKETAISAAVPVAVGAPLKLLNKGLGTLASQLSNVSEETLRKWGTGVGKGAKELKEAHGTQRDVGKKILNAIENYDEFIPEKDMIKNALENMPNIPMAKTIDVIKASIKDFPMPNTNKKAISKLNDLLKDAESKGGELTATEFKAFRGQIDDIVEWGKTGSKKLNGSLKDIRKSLKNELIDVAEQSGNKEYKGLMEGWADKMQKRDALLEEIGANAKSRNKKIGVFMSTLFNKNKETRRKALGDMSEIFGEDFVQQAKLLQMSDAMLQEGGKFSKILPNWQTGKATTSLVPAMAGGAMAKYFESPKALAAAVLLAAEASPMASSKVLSVADLAEWIAKQPAQLGARKSVTKKSGE